MGVLSFRFPRYSAACAPTGERGCPSFDKKVRPENGRNATMRPDLVRFLCRSALVDDGSVARTDVPGIPDSRGVCRFERTAFARTDHRIADRADDRLPEQHAGIDISAPDNAARPSIDGAARF